MLYISLHEHTLNRRKVMDIAIHLTLWIVLAALFGIIILAVLGFLFWPTALYFAWRATGGAYRARKESGSKNMAEAFGIPHPCHLSVEVEKVLGARLPGYTHQETANVLEIPSVLLMEKVENAPIKVTLRFVRVFSVKASSVRRGCHGHYSLAKSYFYDRLCGGDPRCGGGQKGLFAPRWRTFVERLRLMLFLRKNVALYSIPGLVVAYSNKNPQLYVYDNDGKPCSFLDIFCGKEEDIRAYLTPANKEDSDRRLVPIMVKPPS